MTMPRTDMTEPSFPLLITAAESESVEDAIHRIDARLDEIMRVVSMIAENVAPVLESVSKSPLGRMMGM